MRCKACDKQFDSNDWIWKDSTKKDYEDLCRECLHISLNTIEIESNGKNILGYNSSELVKTLRREDSKQ